MLEARHGRDALARLAEHSGQVHLVIADLGMPEMSGSELARQLSAERPGLPVLFWRGIPTARPRGAACRPTAPICRSRLRRMCWRGRCGRCWSADHGDRPRRQRRVGQRHLDLHAAVLLGEPRREAVEPDRRAGRRSPGVTSISRQPTARAPGERLHRLVDRLLGGDPGRGVPGGIGPRGGSPLVVGEELAASRARPCSSSRATLARSTRSIPTPITLTAGLHQNSARPSSGAGTGR